MAKALGNLINMVMRATLKNRALAYWIPVILLTFGIRNFVPPTFDLVEAAKILGIVALFVIFFEYRIFGYRIELRSEELVYRSRGFPTFTTVTVAALEVKAHGAVKIKGGPNSAYHEVELKGHTLYLNVANFWPSEVRELRKWLDHAIRKSN